jgi:hypothetical protein
MATIHASVGMHKNGTTKCYNLPADVQAIVGLLNLVSSSDGAPVDPMPASPSAADLYQAIRNFQKKQNDLGRVPRLSVDGHVDPSGPTLARLNQLATRAPAPFLPDLPEMPRSFGPDPANDPNTVFAGNEFKIKVLEGESYGEVGGGAWYTFAIWDVKNSRGAAYTYKATIGTWGSAYTKHAEGDWGPLTTPKFIQVDQFSGKLFHWGAGFFSKGVMKIRLIGNEFIGADSFSVDIPTGDDTGFGIEKGDGNLTLVPGSVKVFSGP